MKRIAVYSSVLYGADFIAESIQSILPYVDHVYVVMMYAPWGNTEGVKYKNEWIPWPTRFDDTIERVVAVQSDRVTIVGAQKATPWNRWGYAVNDIVKTDADEVILLDPDCVFSKVEVHATFTDWHTHPEYQWAAPLQIELWRTPAWRVHRQRQMVLFLRGDMSAINFPDPPGPPVTHPKIHTLSSNVHNLGFCVSESTMLWKHLTAMAFSPVVGESIPDPEWFEKKWLSWDPVTNNKNLDISLGGADGIPRAVPYDVSLLPQSIMQRYIAKEWPTW